jgi:GPH family glycoside/pentoside/hexuronide:cation symporter
MTDAAAVQKPRLGIGIKTVYGFGSIAFGIKDGGFTVFLLFFYNQVLGLSATAVGLAIAIAIVVDAVSDPIIGEVSDNWRAKLGRRHPFMYGAALPVALLYYLLWSPPHWSSWGLFFYLVVIAVLVRIAIACYEIPSTALAPELSPDYDQRTSLLAYRWMFGLLAVGIMLIVTYGVLLAPAKGFPDGRYNPAGYVRYGIIAAVAMAISILVSAWGTHSRIKTFRQPPVRRRASLGQIAGEMIQSLSHRSLIMVTISGLFGGMATGMGNALNTYFGTYFWHFTAAQLSVIGLAALLGTFAAVVVSPMVSVRFGKKRGFIVSAFASLFVNNITMTLKLLDLLPPAGSNALLLIFFVSTTIGLSLAITSGILVGAMITDVVEDSEMRTGRRSEGLISASLSFVNKATSGLGLLAGSILIDLVHLPVQSPPAVVDRVAPHAAHDLVLIYMPTQMVLWFIAISLITGYRIDRKTHEANLRQLAQAAALAEVSPVTATMAGGTQSEEELAHAPRTAGG